MEINLLAIFDDNEKLKNKQKDINKEKELKKIITSIIEGDESYSSDSNVIKELINDIGIKGKKISYYSSSHIFYNNCYNLSIEYSFKLNKTNIKKIQKYIEREVSR